MQQSSCSDSNRTGDPYLKPIDETLHRRARPILPDGQTIRIEDDSTAARFAELGIETPRFAVLPRNFTQADSADKFVFEETTSALIALGRRVGLSVERPGSGSMRTIHEKDAEVIAPLLAVSHAFLIEGGAALVVAFLEHTVRYLRRGWGPNARDRRIILELSVTKGKVSKRLTYAGDQEGLHQIVTIATEMFDD
jgi:hypothetical protein